MRGGRPFSKRAARSVSAGAPCPPPRPSIMLPSSFARAPTSHEQGKKKEKAHSLFPFFLSCLLVAFFCNSFFVMENTCTFWAVASCPKRPPGRQMASRGTTQPGERQVPAYARKETDGAIGNVSFFPCYEKGGRGEIVEKGIGISWIRDRIGTTALGKPKATRHPRRPPLFLCPLSRSLCRTTIMKKKVQEKTTKSPGGDRAHAQKGLGLPRRIKKKKAAQDMRMHIGCMHA